jgi:predicted metal-dependent hydrolase
MADMKSCIGNRGYGTRFPYLSCHNSGAMDEELYLRGIKLFNSAAYFEAHEVLEDVWRTSPGPEKKFYQGLIQVAVALHHHSKGNLVGARSLLVRAARNLSSYPEDFGGLRLRELLDSIAHWQRALAEGGHLPHRPQFVVDR